MIGETLIALAEDVFAEDTEISSGDGDIYVNKSNMIEGARFVGRFTDYEMAQLNDIASGEECARQWVMPRVVASDSGEPFDPRKALSKEEFTEMCGHCKYRGNG